MAEVLCVYREVQLLKKAAKSKKKLAKPVTIVSYDEKPGIQALHHRARFAARAPRPRDLRA